MICSRGDDADDSEQQFFYGWELAIMLYGSRPWQIFARYHHPTSSIYDININPWICASTFPQNHPADI